MIERILKKLSPRAEFALVATICFGYPVADSIYVMLSQIDLDEVSTSDVLLNTALQLLTLALFALVLRLRGKSFAALAGRPSGGALLAGVPLYLADMLVYSTVAMVVFSVYPRAEDMTAFTFEITAPATVMLVFTVVNSFLEELSVAGYVITALDHEGALFAITVSTFIRFSYHLYQGPVASISILPLGLLFSAVYWYTRNLWPLIVAHTIANVVSLASTT
jgi:membrane protease YdiL (CAAX protease family)